MKAGEINHFKTKYLNNQKMGNVASIVKEYIDTYKERGFNVIAIHADNAFDKIKSSDSFGYIAQGLGYGMAADKPFKGWIALNKSTGEIAFADAVNDDEEKEEVNAKIRKSIMATDVSKPFQRQFSDIPEVFYKKETGNRTLGVECSWCDYKHECWANLEFKRQLPSKGKNPKFIWYTHITDEWREREASDNV